MSYQPPILGSEFLDGFSVRYLKLSGMWATINHQRTTGKKNLIIRVSLIFTLIMGTPYVTFQFICFFTTRIDLQKATFLTTHLSILFQLLSKLLVFWFRMGSICWLNDLARKDFLAIPEVKRPHVEKIFKKITKKTDKISFIIILSTCGPMILSFVYPVVPIDYITDRTDNMAGTAGGKMKILGGWYPVPMDQSPYYEVIFTYEVAASIWAATILNVFMILFYQLLMCLYAQFTVLAYLISTLKVEATDSNKSKNDIHHRNNNTDINKELYDILQDHQKLLSYANELRSVYNPLVTIILGMGIFLLVVVLFQFLFGGAESLMFKFRSLQYLAYQVAEVCMFCFGSSSVQAASSDVQFAIYSSDWYKADVKFRKSAQMLMVRARKGVTLTAIKMYPVNVETIMAIFQFIYSTTTLMSRMAE